MSEVFGLERERLLREAVGWRQRMRDFHAGKPVAEAVKNSRAQIAQQTLVGDLPPDLSQQTDSIRQENLPPQRPSELEQLGGWIFGPKQQPAEQAGPTETVPRAQPQPEEEQAPPEPEARIEGPAAPGEPTGEKAPYAGTAGMAVQAPETVSERVDLAKEANRPARTAAGALARLGGGAVEVGAETLDAVTWGVAKANDASVNLGLTMWDDVSRLFGADPEDRERFAYFRRLNAHREPDGWLGGMASAITQFLAGYAAAFGPVGQGVKGAFAGTRMAAPYVEQIGIAAKGAAAGFMAFDPHDERMSTLLNEIPALDQFISDWMASTDAEHGEYAGRAKTAIEEAILGPLGEAVSRPLAKALGHWIQVKKAGRPETGLAGPEAAVSRESAQTRVAAERAAGARVADSASDLTLEEAGRKAEVIEARAEQIRAERQAADAEEMGEGEIDPETDPARVLSAWGGVKPAEAKPSPRTAGRKVEEPEPAEEFTADEEPLEGGEELTAEQAVAAWGARDEVQEHGAKRLGDVDIEAAAGELADKPSGTSAVDGLGEPPVRWPKADEVSARPDEISDAVHQAILLDSSGGMRMGSPELADLVKGMRQSISDLPADQLGEVLNRISLHLRRPRTEGDVEVLPFTSSNAGGVDVQGFHSARFVFDELTGTKAQQTADGAVLERAVRDELAERAGQVLDSAPEMGFVEWMVSGPADMAAVVVDKLGAVRGESATSLRDPLGAARVPMLDDWVMGSSYTAEGVGPGIWVSTAHAKRRPLARLRADMETAVGSDKRDVLGLYEARESLARIMDDSVALTGDFARRNERIARLNERPPELEDLLLRLRRGDPTADPAEAEAWRATLSPEVVTAGQDLDLMLGMAQQIGRMARGTAGAGLHRTELFARSLLHFQQIGRELAGDLEGAGRIASILEDVPQDMVGEGAATKALGGADEVRKVASVISNSERLDEGLIYARESFKGMGKVDMKTTAEEAMQAAVTIRGSSMLSGPRTHIRNILGNVVPLALAVPDQFLASSIRALKSRQGEDVAAIWEDTWGAMSGMWRGIRYAHKLAARDAGMTWTGRGETFRRAQYAKTKEEGLQAILRAFQRRPKGEPMGEHMTGEGMTQRELSPGKSMLPWNWWKRGSTTANPLVNTPYVALQAADVWFKDVNYMMTLQPLVQREGRAMGLRGAELKAYVGQQVQEAAFDRTNPLHQQALQQAERNTFTNDPGTLGQKVVDMANAANGIGRLAVPFPRTPTNIVTYAAERIPGLNFISKHWRDQYKKGGDAQNQAIARVTTGTGLIGAAWALAESGQVTGCAEPGKFAQTGVRPCSIQMGGNQMDYRFLPALNVVLSAGSSAAQAYHMAETDEDRELVWGIVSNLGYALGSLVEDMPIEGLNDLYELLDGLNNEEISLNTVQRFLGGLVAPSLPLNSLRHDVSGRWQASGRYSGAGGGPEDGWGEWTEWLDEVWRETFPIVGYNMLGGDRERYDLHGDRIEVLSPGKMRDSDGNETTWPAALGAGLLGPQVWTAGKDDPLSLAEQGLGEHLNLQRYPRKADWTSDDGRPIKVEYTQEEQSLFARTAGKYYFREGTREVQQGRWDGYTAAERADRLEAIQADAFRVAQRTVREQFPRLDREYAKVPIRIQHRNMVR